MEKTLYELYTLLLLYEIANGQDWLPKLPALNQSNARVFSPATTLRLFKRSEAPEMNERVRWPVVPRRRCFFILKSYRCYDLRSFFHSALLFVRCASGLWRQGRSLRIFPITAMKRKTKSVIWIEIAGKQSNRKWNCKGKLRRQRIKRKVLIISIFPRFWNAIVIQSLNKSLLGDWRASVRLRQSYARMDALRRREKRWLLDWLLLAITSGRLVCRRASRPSDVPVSSEYSLFE